MTDGLERDANDTPEKGLPMLTVEFSCTGSRWLLIMNGELNRSSIAAVEVHIDQLACSECRDIVLDLTGLTAVDPVGTRVLEGMSHYVRALGARLTVTGASGHVAEALRSTRLDQGLDGTEDAPTVSYPLHFARPGFRPFASPNFIP